MTIGHDLACGDQTLLKTKSWDILNFHAIEEDSLESIDVRSDDFCAEPLKECNGSYNNDELSLPSFQPEIQEPFSDKVEAKKDSNEIGQTLQLKKVINNLDGLQYNMTFNGDAGRYQDHQSSFKDQNIIKPLYYDESNEPNCDHSTNQATNTDLSVSPTFKMDKQSFNIDFKNYDI